MSRRNKTGIKQRRAVVAVQVAIMLTVLLGFAALTIDVGALYNAKAELQMSADAAALAAAGMLGEHDVENPTLAMTLAQDVAYDMALEKQVLGHTVPIDKNVDVVFGRANYDSINNVYTFNQTTNLPDAVQVTVRMTNDSPSGPFPLFFARVLGFDYSQLNASATAMMVPRDIAVVADLSGSHNDDSEFYHYKRTTINMHELWDGFPGGIDDSPGEWAGLGYAADDPQAAGPAWGYMKYLGYGTDPIQQNNYYPQNDPGLIQLHKNYDWSDSNLKTYLKNIDGLGYTNTEWNKIRDKDRGDWDDRVAVALGLARWNSGKSGGWWQKAGRPKIGDGDNKVENWELEWVETFGARSLNESKTVFTAYINYMDDTNSQLYYANSNFYCRFGVKTFVNFLLEDRPDHGQTPELANAPHQPMQAVKDSVDHMMTVIEGLENDDQVSLEIYGTDARHEVDLTHDYASVAARLNDMQAAHYNSYTCIGGGILRAREELASERARMASRKIIVLLTDGNANINQWGNYSISGGKQYAKDQASAAAEEGIRIFCVSVSTDADTDLMQWIADIGNGSHFHAEGTIEEYSDQLDAIFNTLGGERPVELIR